MPKRIIIEDSMVLKRRQGKLYKYISLTVKNQGVRL